MNITARKLLTISFTAVFVLSSAMSMGMSGTDSMADGPGIRTVIFGVT